MRFTIAVALVLATRSVAVAGDSPADIAAQTASAAIASQPFPGMSIAIVQDGKTTFAGGFGKAELENDVGATDTTVYRINSITKAMTATVILRLAELGKLRIDDHLSKYLPEYAHDFDPTLVQLLNHTAGVANYEGPSFHENIKLDLDIKQWVESLANKKLFIAPPGRAWSYSNPAYDLLAMIASKLEGEPFAHLLDKHVFAPAGMTQSSPCAERRVIPHRAASYEWHKDHFERAESWGTYGLASSGVCSSVLDLVRFVQALDGGKLLSAKSLARMRTPGTLGSTTFDYGFGVRLGRLGGMHVLAYTGSGEDWASAIYEVPDRKLIVIVLANGDAPAGSTVEIASEIARRLLGVSDSSLDLDVPAALAARLTGRSHLAHQAGETSAEITFDGHHLTLQLKGAPAFRMYYQGASAFRFAPNSAPGPDSVELVFDSRTTPIPLATYIGGVFAQLAAIEKDP